MRMKIRICAYKHAYIRTYAYTRLFISMYELAYCLCIVSGLLFQSLTALRNYTTTNYIRLDGFSHRSRRPSRYAVASVYELNRKHVLIDINGLFFSNGTFKSRGDIFHYLCTNTISVATAWEHVQNKFNIGASYFSRINKEARL